MLVACQHNDSFMPVLCQYNDSFMPVLCQYNVGSMSVLCQYEKSYIFELQVYISFLCRMSVYSLISFTNIASDIMYGPFTSAMWQYVKPLPMPLSTAT